MSKKQPMSSFKVFGYEWEDIQHAQQGGKLNRRVTDTSRPVDHTVTDDDRALLAKHGTVEALETAGFFGSADRLRRAANQLNEAQSK